MEVIVSKRGINRFGIRKYSCIKSKSTPNSFYTVGKIRKRGSKNYKYVCTCPDHLFRQKTCKHIKEFKLFER